MAAAPGGTRIVLVASFDEALYHHNALRRRALERLGCTVTTFDLQKPGLMARLRGGSLSERLARALGQAAPDLVLVMEGVELAAPTVAAIKRETSAVWANWIPGDARRVRAVESLAIAYDRVFVAGRDLVGPLAAPGMLPPAYLPLAADPSVHRPMRARDQFRANVVFAGTATPRRAELLAELVEFGLAIWGPGWRKTPLRDYCRGELLPERDYVRAYAGASVAINIHRQGEDGAPDGTGVNQRTFELAAIGVPQVLDFRADLPQLFDVGRELYAFHTPGELKALVQGALHDPAAADHAAAAGRRRVLAEHTYMHRMAELLGALAARR